LVTNTSGYRFVFNQFIKLYLGHISQARNMLILSIFLKSLLEKYGLHTIYPDVGTEYSEA